MNNLSILALASSVGLFACFEPSADLCLTQRFEAQATARFVAGETFYLPVIDASPSCAKLRWTVVERPESSTDPIVEGKDGIWRITPTVAGHYRFSLAEAPGGDETLDLEVVPASDRAFYNLNYYPANSLTAVGDELWVANAQSPTVSRVEPSTLAVLDEIDVGPWPVSIAWVEGMTFAVVAQRGADTLGLIDVETKRLVDAIWVGDEPANVIVTADGKQAYVALQSENAVAVVDLEARVRTARIEVGSSPLAMALSADEGMLWVASHRSGQPGRFPYEADSVEDERDVAVIDTAAGEVVDWWLDVGTTITALALAPDGERLYMSRLRNDTEANLSAIDEPSFMYEIAMFDAASGDELQRADLSRQPSSGGYAVALHAITLAANQLWVVAESSDLAIALDPETLAELDRVEVLGRPRSLTAIGDTVYAHGAQASSLTAISPANAAPQVLALTTDPRPAEVAAGQYFFTGAGRDYAQNWTCNSCHVDGLSDTLVWNAGPFAGRRVSRPFYWLEGTYPLGWDGYLSSVENYAFTVNINVGVRPTTEEHRALSAYLASIMPPPAANEFTRRDGTLSELGEAGKRIYENEAGCATCHPLPLTTSRATLAQGITEGVTDVPGLVGSYRLGVWLKRGEATTLHDAVERVFGSLGDPGLDEDQRAALDRFLLELTARDFMVLTSSPRAGNTTMAVDQPIGVVFSHPVFNDAGNLAKVTLIDASGAEVEVTRQLSADARHLELTPKAALAFEQDYTVIIDPSFESFGEQTLWTPDPAAPSAWEIPLQTGAAPQLRLAGDYVWTVDMPTADLEATEFDLDNTIATAVPLSVVETQSGGEMLLDYGEDLTLERVAVVVGGLLVTPALPIPIGPSFADTTGIQATLIDEDDDGIADYAEGSLTIAGPGFLESGVTWRLTRPTVIGECNEGSTGALPVTVEFGAEGPIVDWGSDMPDGLGVYFIGPDAQPPAGPGQPVTGGDAHWVVQVADFPNGFAGPVTYGVVPDGAIDDTANVGGGDGPATLSPGQCVKAAVTTTAFGQGSVTFVVP
ncbi:collagen triple helix repeat domain protein [Enhygromyxa salina]|uniref:Collagen triple helix repeat domain protein n=1 Tax=Enhygromyxa salina TaxID=215803 RepID=A0A0C2A713_9BACT|nr:collagen triple helix repeat domain protein [Enhygromyxa salina]